jgi:hypothetical protein
MLPVYEGQRVVLSTPGGSYRFARDDFRRIEPGPWPERDWKERLRVAEMGGLDERFAAARWALEQGLTGEAIEQLRRIHAADRSHQPTARMAAALERLERACEEPDLDSIRALLPGSFREARGPHVVVLHQHEEAEARERVETLEKVIATFYLELAALGFELEAPRRRRVSVWFADHADYLSYLQRDGAGAFRATRGYHHPARGLVVLYDARSEKGLRRGLEAIAARRAELAELSRRIEAAPRGALLSLSLRDSAARSYHIGEARRALDVWTRDADREALLLELTYKRLNMAPAAHETVHQLVSASGLMAGQGDFPAWLQEGLAMQYEVVREGRWGGTGNPAEIRLERWKTQSSPPLLSSVLSDEGLGPGAGGGSYAAAWAWVYFLRREHPAVLQAVMDELRLPSGTSASASRRARAALPDGTRRRLHDWEREWHAFMKQVAKTEHGSIARKTAQARDPVD